MSICHIDKEFKKIKIEVENVIKCGTDGSVQDRPEVKNLFCTEETEGASSALLP